MHRKIDDHRCLRAHPPWLEGARCGSSYRPGSWPSGARQSVPGRLDPALQGQAVTAPIIDFSFPHTWTAEILAARPLILPPRHYVYPRDAEEVERGALEVLIRPLANKESDPGALKGHDSSSAENTALKAPDFSRAENAALKGHNFSCAENTALKGHDFSRAENTPIETGALAPEG